MNSYLILCCSLYFNYIIYKRHQGKCTDSRVRYMTWGLEFQCSSQLSPNISRVESEINTEISNPGRCKYAKEKPAYFNYTELNRTFLCYSFLCILRHYRVAQCENNNENSIFYSHKSLASKCRQAVFLVVRLRITQHQEWHHFYTTKHYLQPSQVWSWLKS